MARQDPREQAGRGAGIAHVQHVGGFDQAADATPGDPPDMVIIARHLGPQRAHRRGGAQHVLAFQQAGDHCLADRQRAEHQRAVADRLVAGHAHDGAQRGRGTAGGERTLGIGVHGRGRLACRLDV
jgi:hypothetical protein